MKISNRVESLFVAVLMAAVGGYLDIYTYMARGKVFANTQTGNLVLLGYNMAEGNGKKVGYYLLSIFSFAIGVAAAEFIEHKWKERRGLRWIHVTIALEILLLLCVMYIPKGGYNLAANMMVSFVCGLQVQTFRKVKGVSYSTTMFTGNVKNAAERISHFYITKEGSALSHAAVYLIVIGMFIAGAFIGTQLTKCFGEKSVGWVAVPLLTVFWFLYYEQNDVEEGERRS